MRDYREVSLWLQALVPHSLVVAPTDDWAASWVDPEPTIQLDPGVPWGARALLVVHEAAHLLDWRIHGPGVELEDPDRQHDADHGPSWGLCYAAVWRYLGGL